MVDAALVRSRIRSVPRAWSFLSTASSPTRPSSQPSLGHGDRAAGVGLSKARIAYMDGLSISVQDSSLGLPGCYLAPRPSTSASQRGGKRFALPSFHVIDEILDIVESDNATVILIVGRWCQLCAAELPRHRRDSPPEPSWGYMGTARASPRGRSSP